MIKDGGEREAQYLSIGTSWVLASTNVFRPLHRPIACPLPSIGIHQQNALDPLELNSTLPQPGAPLLPLAGDEARGHQEEPPANCTSRGGSLVQDEAL